MTLRRVLSHCLPLQILKLKSVPRNHAARSRSRRCSQGATPWGLCSWPPFLLLTDDDDDELGVRGALAHWKSLAADCNLKCSQRCYLNADTVAVHQMTAADPVEVLWKCLLYKPTAPAWAVPALWLLYAIWCGLYQWPTWVFAGCFWNAGLHATLPVRGVVGTVYECFKNPFLGEWMEQRLKTAAMILGY